MLKSGLGTRCEIDQKWILQNLTNEKSTLVGLVPEPMLTQICDAIRRHQATINAKETYLHCWRTGVTSVLHQAIEVIDMKCDLFMTRFLLIFYKKSL